MKKLPDCRNSAPNVPGARRCVTSMASAPRLAPMPTGSRPAASAAPARRRRTARASTAPSAEYHSSRGPGASRATRCGGSVTGGDHRAAVAGEAGELVVLRPVVGHQQRQGWPSPALQMRPSTSRRVRGARIASSSSSPSTASAVEPRGRLVAAVSRTDFSPNAPGARCGLAGSGPSRWCRRRWSSSSWYSSRATAAPRSRAPSRHRRAGSCVGVEVQVRAEPDGGVAPVRVGDAERQGVGRYTGAARLDGVQQARGNRVRRGRTGSPADRCSRPARTPRGS